MHADSYRSKFRRGFSISIMYCFSLINACIQVDDNIDSRNQDLSCDQHNHWATKLALYLAKVQHLQTYQSTQGIHRDDASIDP